jgi:hypothetical protein
VLHYQQQLQLLLLLLGEVAAVVLQGGRVRTGVPQVLK